MITAFSYACVGQQPVEWKSGQKIGSNLRLAHKLAFVQDCILGLAILALGYWADCLELGLSSQTQFAVLGFGSCYSLGMLIFIAVMLKDKYCAHVFLVKSPKAVNAAWEALHQ